MLEQKIAALTEAVEAMTAEMGRLNVSIERLSSDLPADTRVDNTEAEGVTAPSLSAVPSPKERSAAPGSEDKEVPAVSREDVQDLCMRIVREDRSKRAMIASAISAYDGAKTLKDVSEQSLAALKADLEGL